MRHHHRREPSFYFAWLGPAIASWALVIGLGYGLMAIAVYLVAD